MNKLLPLILILFSVPCFAEIEGAFGIKLGEIFDLEIIDDPYTSFDLFDPYKNFDQHGLLKEPFCIKERRGYVTYNL
jgi:hypothetical protein